MKLLRFKKNNNNKINYIDIPIRATMQANTIHVLVDQLLLQEDKN